MKQFLAVLLFVLFLGQPLWAANDVEFRFVTAKTISDKVMMEQLRRELILGDEAIERIMLVDVMNDGFDETDVVLLYPTGRVLRLRPISPALDSLLRSFTVPVNVAVYEARKQAAYFDTLASKNIGPKSLGYGLLSGLSRAIERGYHGTDVEGTFKFSLTGASLMAWNFDSVRIYFPPPEPTPRDTIVLTNVLERIDTVVIHDTVYVSDAVLRPPRSMYYRVALACIGGRYDMTQRKPDRQRLILGAGNEWDFAVWSPWVSGRQDIRARVGLRFMVEMAPWVVDSLSPSFLTTSFETLWIPAWDRPFFIFGGIRALYRDDLFWDPIRSARDDDEFEEPAVQDMSRYEVTARCGVDKLSAFGPMKNLGAWLKTSFWFNAGSSEQYLRVAETPAGDSFEHYYFKYKNATEIEGAFSLRFSETGQAVASLGYMAVPNLDYRHEWTIVDDAPIEGLVSLGQFYQTLSLRWAPFESLDFSRLLFEMQFRNNSLVRKHIKRGSDDARLAPELEEILYPYMETPAFSGSLRLDVSIFRISGGASIFMPPEGRDTQTRFFGELRLMFR
ncbi:MAG: hypothetical protein FJY66_02655 [Calditrichaeota bacterium]|nr:hypothetical protein [Calditrichota bacterium]